MHVCHDIVTTISICVCLTQTVSADHVWWDRSELPFSFDVLQQSLMEATGTWWVRFQFTGSDLSWQPQKWALNGHHQGDLSEIFITPLHKHCKICYWIHLTNYSSFSSLTLWLKILAWWWLIWHIMFFHTHLIIISVIHFKIIIRLRQNESSVLPQ